MNAPLSAIDPRDADAVVRAAVQAGALWQDEAALSLIARSQALNPRDARLWQMEGLAHRSLDDLAAAVRALEHARRLAPADPQIAHALARATLEAGLPAAALFEEAHRLAPLQAPVLLGLAAARLDEGQGAMAIEGLADQLRQHPGWAEGHAALARLRWSLGARDTYVASFTEALAADPRNGVLWRDLAITHLRAEEFDAVARVTTAARRALGASRTLDLIDAAALSERGEPAAAEALYAALLPITEPGWIVFRLRHLLRLGRPDLAVREGEAAMRATPSEDFWPLLALAWRLTGNPRHAWLEGDPRLVSTHDLPVALAPLAERLRTLHRMKAQPLDQSVRGGTQTDGPLFARIDPEIRALRAAVVAAVRAHIDQLPPPDPTHPTLRHPRGPVRFAGSWSVRLTGGGRHVNHVHPAGWISSALYVVLPGEDGKGEPRGGWLTLGEADELGVSVPALRNVEPRPGRLVLFPSTMWHGTRPFVEGERLTVAFDIAPPPC
ncbi:putative 2OG-Fe(II) oxygenase [Sphingomonas sp.]|uniref:putative 2OG-Fe(II) oxygenase n=1 Tax=Sphingomonas sp. TaxID=28214 RepID=UPI0035C7D421